MSTPYLAIFFPFNIFFFSTKRKLKLFLGIDCVVFLELLYKRKINREINVLYDVKNREKGFPLMKAFIHSIYEFSHP
jgi:hypothetical protein